MVNEASQLLEEDSLKKLTDEKNPCWRKLCGCCCCMVCCLLLLLLMLYTELFPGLPGLKFALFWCRLTTCLNFFNPNRGADCDACETTYTDAACASPIGVNGIPLGYLTAAVQGLGGIDIGSILRIPSNCTPESVNITTVPADPFTDIAGSWEQIWAQGKAYPAGEWSGTTWRGNELGFLVENPYFWSDSGIWPQSLTLGILPSQHSAIRPFLVEMFQMSRVEEIVDVKKSARSFIQERQDAGTLAVPADIQVWVHQVLYRCVFDKEISYEAAQDFIVVQQQVVSMATASQAFPANLYGMLEATRDSVNGYIAEYTRLLDSDPKWGKKLADLDCSPSSNCTRQLASAVWDAFFSAGGLSVPQVIACGLGILYSDSSTNPSKGFKLRSDQALTFFWESLRYFPPVVGFPAWTTRPTCAGFNADETAELNHPHGRTKACPRLPVNEKTGFPPVNQWQGGHRLTLSLPAGQWDPDKWGPTANEFQLRPRRTYQQNSVGFAEMAVDDSVADGTMNRNCPAKELALLVGSSFFEAFKQDDWSADDANITLKRAAASFSVSKFSLSFNSQN